MTQQTTSSTGNVLTALLTDQSATATPQRRSSAVRAPASPDGKVYGEAAAVCLPRWLRVLGPAPWLSGAGGSRGRSRRVASLLHRQQAAAVAVGLLADSDGQRADATLLRECVRATLIQWQLLLTTEGRPTQRLLLRSPFQAVTASLIMQLLNETAGFQTNRLLYDMGKHLRWLIASPPQTPWIEAATVCALTDGAVLIRDASLLAEGRRRLRKLLTLQDEEGWFPERGGADIGRLSLIVDAFARVLHHNRWEELTDPLAKMLRFLRRLVHPDGTIGGCYSSCGTAFLSPYGVELLASVNSDAAALASVCRRRYRKLITERFCTWHDDLCILLAPRIALAARCPAKTLSPVPPDPTECKPHTRFPNAGLSVFVTDAYHAVVGGYSGGALHVTWRGDSACLDEHGVTVISPRGPRSSGRWSRSTQTDVWYGSSGGDTPSSVTSSGALHPVDRGRRWQQGLLRRTLSWVAQRGAPGKHPRGRTPARPCATSARRLARGRYRRVITFEDNLIRIVDTVRCILPCQAILCQSPSRPDADRYVDGPIGSRRTCGPIFVDGGKNVEVTRVYRDGKLIAQCAPQCSLSS